MASERQFNCLLVNLNIAQNKWRCNGSLGKKTI